MRKLYYILLTSIPLLALMVGCSYQGSSPASIPRAELDIGVYKVEAGKFTNIVSGNVTSEESYLNSMLVDANTADDSFVRMLKGVGGSQAYSDLLYTLDSRELRRLHTKYGTSYSDNSVTLLLVQRV